MSNESNLGRSEAIAACAALAAATALLLAACAQSQPAIPPGDAREMLRPRFSSGCLIPDLDPFKGAPPFTIRLDLSVSPSGSVQAVRVAESSGTAAVDEAFTAAARECKFLPDTKAGRTAPRTYPLAFSRSRSFTPSGLARCFVPIQTSYMNDMDGTVILRFRLPSASAEAEIEVGRSSGSASFDRQAMEFARLCLARQEVKADLKPGAWSSQALDLRFK